MQSEKPPELIREERSLIHALSRFFQWLVAGVCTVWCITFLIGVDMNPVLFGLLIGIGLMSVGVLLTIQRHFEGRAKAMPHDDDGIS